ncbi:MAG TPA: M28 family peptidase [Allosphingosinicella sp.]|nr:M28 family peptidase [Allosphingosinicella sp.]
MRASIGNWGAAALALALCLPLGGGASAQAPSAQAARTVRPEAVKADEDFLAGDALQGRGSATPDEAKAAVWVAARFKEFGLVPAPGMDSYLQTATIVEPKVGGAPELTLAGHALPGLTLLSAPAAEVSGKLAVATSSDPAGFPDADVVALASGNGSLRAMARAMGAHHVKLLIVRQSAETDRIWQQMGGETRMPSYLEGDAPRSAAIAILPAVAFDSLAGQGGQEVALTLPGLMLTRRTTTNAIGFLPGTDPNAGVLLLSAHLDHLGRRPDGTIMHGADDDASGTTAVVELARALAAGPRSRRGILFVCYGSEELGGFGSRWFGAHPPVPLTKIAANIEFEMIGAPDPKLPKGSLMMTGYERSNLGETLAAHGALVSADPYPDEHFFERSDNYSLALKGVVAHTLSGWAVTPVYHQPTDTIANLDIPFMTRAIQSLIEPVRWLAASDFQPQWKPGGRPGQ